MRHIKPGESIVMQEFERIAAEKGWMTKNSINTGFEASHLPSENVSKYVEHPKDPFVEKYVNKIRNDSRSTKLNDKIEQQLQSKQKPQEQKPQEQKPQEQKYVYYDKIQEILRSLNPQQLNMIGLSLGLTGQPNTWAKKIAENPSFLSMFQKYYNAAVAKKPARKGHPFNSLVQKAQNVLLEYFNDYMALGDNGADGRWGKNTAKAWNDWVQAVKYAPGLELHLVDPNGANLPSNEELVYVAGKYGQSLRESRKFNPSSKEVKPTPQTERVTDLKNPWASLNMKNIKTADDLDKMLEKVPLEEEQKTTSDREALIQKAQHLLEMYGEDLGPKGTNGKWGWFTSKAWNSYIKKVPTAGLPQTTPQQPPSDKDIIKMLGTNPSQQLEPEYFAKEQQMTQPGLAPTASIHIINELIVLANDLDEMGETKVATAVDEQLRLYKTAVDKLYDITGETGEQLIGEAHPGGGPTMVPAKDEGGKVETIVEEQKKDLAVIDKQPTGKQAAFIAKQLVALANRLDAEGKVEAALLVDKTLAELREGSARPFVVKQAIAPLLIGLALIGLPLASFLFSKSEELYNDLEDYLAILDKLAKDNPEYGSYGKELHTKLEPYINFFKQPIPTVKDLKRKDYVQVLQQFGKNILPELEKITSSIPKDYWTIGFGKSFRIRDKLSDIKTAYKEQLDKLSAGESVENMPTLQIPGYGTPSQQSSQQGGTKEYQKSTLSPQEKEAFKKSYDNYKGTINKLINVLTDETKQYELQKHFGGETNVEKLINALENLLKSVKEPTTRAEKWKLDNQNRKLYNYYIKGLKERKIMASLKIAEDAPKGMPVFTTLTGTVKSGTTPGKKTQVKRPLIRKEVRDDLRQLQGLMNQLQDMPPGRPGIADGKWGPKTREAWETMRSWTQNRAFNQSPPANDPRGPLPGEVSKAIRVAEFIINRQQGTNSVSMGGVEVRVAALSNVDNFLKELARLGKIQKAETGSLNTTANRRVAVQILQSFIETTESDATLVAKFGKDGINSLVNRANALISELERPVGIGDYSMPAGGGQQYGRQQGYQHGENIGEFGNLSGRQERGGTSQQRQPQRGYEKNRPEPEMSLENEIRTLASENIPINDVQEALFWAHDFWKRHWQEMEDLGEGRKDYYVVARAVVKYLRQEIARLRGQLARTPIDNKNDLDLELRRLSEDLSQMAQLLKR